MRRSIASLQEGPEPRRPLQEELARLSDEFSDGTPDIRLRDELAQYLYLAPDELAQVSKVVREALLNVYQHAHASQVIISATSTGTEAEIAIVDDGCGFDSEAQEEAAGDHFGLSIMKARAARVGGKLAIRSHVGRGTEVVLTWRPRMGLALSEGRDDRQIPDYVAMELAVK